MCGRYSFFTPIQSAAESLQLQIAPLMEWHPTYNAAPSQVMPIVTNEFPKIIQFFKWGLVPQWAKDPAMGQRMINSRHESILEKPAINAIFKYKRCIVLADGYYEWQKTGNKTKQPIRFHLANNNIMLLAGLYDTWGEGLQTFSIITTAANDAIAPIHDRMPILLNLREAATWLSNREQPKTLLQLLNNKNMNEVQHYAITNLVNNAAYNHANILQPLQTLF
jgi:putative SOS response-associated peptidase YedK